MPTKWELLSGNMKNTFQWIWNNDFAYKHIFPVSAFIQFPNQRAHNLSLDRSRPRRFLHNLYCVTSIGPVCIPSCKLHLGKTHYSARHYSILRRYQILTHSLQHILLYKHKCTWLSWDKLIWPLHYRLTASKFLPWQG